jgi:hypothetical protein
VFSTDVMNQHVSCSYSVQQLRQCKICQQPSVLTWCALLHAIADVSAQLPADMQGTAQPVQASQEHAVSTPVINTEPNPAGK